MGKKRLPYGNMAKKGKGMQSYNISGVFLHIWKKRSAVKKQGLNMSPLTKK